MAILKKYRFSNGNRMLEIRIGSYTSDIGVSVYDGNLTVSDEDIISLELLSDERKEGKLFKKTVKDYYLLYKYVIGGIQHKEEYEKKMPILETDAEDAAQACLETKSMLMAVKQRKEEYSKEQDRKLAEARKNDVIEAYDLDGNIIKIWRREFFFNDIVLVADGGNAYHTHADCYEEWKPEYRRKFDKWRLMKKDKAISEGLCECKLCEKYYDLED